MKCIFSPHETIINRIVYLNENHHGLLYHFNALRNLFSLPVSYYEQWGPALAQKVNPFLLFHIRDFCICFSLCSFHCFEEGRVCWQKVTYFHILTRIWQHQNHNRMTAAGLFGVVARPLSIKCNSTPPTKY